MYARRAALLGVKWTPLLLFRSGEQGGWWDPSDFSTMFQDSAGTTPVTAVQQPVGKILDKSGRGNHRTQATAASRPTLKALYNLLAKTQEFDDALWAKTACTIPATVYTSGAYSGRKMIPNAGSVAPLIGQNAITATVGNSYTSSFIVEKGDFRYVGVFELNSGSGAGLVVFDLLTGTVTGAANGAVVGNGSITALGGGLYLVKYTYIATATPVAPRLYISGSGTNLTNVTGDGASGIYVYGADLRITSDTLLNIPAYQHVTSASVYDTSDFPYYLSYDGVDDGHATGNVNFSATDKMSVFAGATKLSDAAAATLIELSANFSANNGSFGLFAPTAASPTYAAGSHGDAVIDGSQTSTATPYAAPNSGVLTATHSIAGDLSTLSVNGVAAANAVGDQGAGNFGNYPLYFGRRGGASLPFTGREYASIVRGAASTAAEIALVQRYVGSKMGITL